MIKKYIFLFFIISSLIVDAQENKFQIGITFSPDISYRHTVDKANNSFTQVFEENKDEFEDLKLSYTTGIHLKYKLSKHLCAQFGVNYTNKGYKNPKSEWGYNSDTTGFINYTRSIGHIHYLEVPIQLQLSSDNEKFNFYGGLGLVPGVLLRRDQIEIESLEGEKSVISKITLNTPKSHYRRVSITTYLSAGVSYQANDKFALQLGPEFRYQFLSHQKRTSIREYFWSCGLMLGCFYTLPGK